MRIAIGSIFRNATGYIPRYFAQVRSLGDELRKDGIPIHLIMAEGDSTDGTRACLQSYAAATVLYHGAGGGVAHGSKSTVVEADHGGVEFGSVDDPTRWRNVSFVCNKLLDRVEPEDDYLIYVESDLIWVAATMLTLLGDLAANPSIGAIAAMCFKYGQGWFYDTWGHRKNGMHFVNSPPYHPDVGLGITPIDSAGSCIVMRGDVARRCRFDPPEMGIVGFGQDMRRKSFQLCLNPLQAVFHP